MASSPSVRHRLRRLGEALIGAGVAASLFLVPPAAGSAASRPAAAAAPPVPRLRWVGCGQGFQCARAQVPLDYDAPQSATISLALARLPASDRAHKLGSIFLNPGGPGGSGVDFVRGAGHELFSAEVRARFDLVGFDPRGIARSVPLRCFATAAQAAAAATRSPFPVTPAQERARTASDRKIAEACARRAGPIINHMATADVARDLDLLRQAVGDDQLTYYGLSYGSYLGVTYANLFPRKVRALAVDGVVDPIAWATGRGSSARRLPVFLRLGSDQGSDATLRQFFRLCRQGERACAFSAGDPRRRYDRLANRLRAQPAQIPVGKGRTDGFTYADLTALTSLALYVPAVWPQLATLLDKLDTSPNSQAAAVALRTLLARLGVSEHQSYAGEGLDGVLCSDTDNPTTAEAWSRAGARADRVHPYFGRYWAWLSSICRQWPGKDGDRYTGPFTARTVHPVLVIGNRFDPATPYQGAVTVSRLLPRARLLTLDGWGHTTLFSGSSLFAGSSCVNAYLSRYLVTTQLPPRGTICKPDVVPFTQSVSPATSTLAIIFPPVVDRKSYPALARGSRT